MVEESQPRQGSRGGSSLGAVCVRGRRGAYFLRYVFSGPMLLKLLKNRRWGCEINVTWLCSSVRCFVFYQEGQFGSHTEKKNTLIHPNDALDWEGGYSGRCFILKGWFKATSLCSKTSDVGSSPCRKPGQELPLQPPGTARLAAPHLTGPRRGRNSGSTKNNETTNHLWKQRDLLGKNSEKDPRWSKPERETAII